MVDLSVWLKNLHTIKKWYPFTESNFKVWEILQCCSCFAIMVLTCETSSCEKVMNKVVLYALLIVQLQIVCHLEVIS